MPSMLERLKTKASEVFCFVFHTGFEISNFNVWTAKHLMQASWTELALKIDEKNWKVEPFCNEHGFEKPWINSLKFRYSEKATKFEKNLPVNSHILTLLIDVKQSGWYFFQIFVAFFRIFEL